MLVVSNLVKSYRGRRVVDGVSFDVGKGEIVGLLGPNGAGKTTSFRMTVGMVPPDSGKVELEGRNVTRWPVYRRARAGIGYLTQETSVFRGLTTEENLVAILERVESDRRARRERLERLLHEFGLLHVRAGRATQLSGGEKRRLEFARALITQPKVILLDEPFAGIDPKAVADLQGIVKRLAQGGIGFLLTDHSVRETLATADRLYVIHEGRILKSGSPEDVLACAAVREVYLGERFHMDLEREKARFVREPEPVPAPIAEVRAADTTGEGAA